MEYIQAYALPGILARERGSTGRTGGGLALISPLILLYSMAWVQRLRSSGWVAHLAIHLGSRGTVNIMTLPAISIQDLHAKLTRLQQMGRA